MDTLPNIERVIAEVRDAKEHLVQVSEDLSEERYTWTMSLKTGGLDHQLFKRLFRAKAAGQKIVLSIEFDPADPNQMALLFPLVEGERHVEELDGDPGMTEEEWEYTHVGRDDKPLTDEDFTPAAVEEARGGRGRRTASA